MNKDVLKCILCGMIVPDPDTPWRVPCPLNGGAEHVNPFSDDDFLKAVYCWRTPVIPLETLNAYRQAVGAGWTREDGTYFNPIVLESSSLPKEETASLPGDVSHTELL